MRRSLAVLVTMSLIAGAVACKKKAEQPPAPAVEPAAPAALAAQPEPAAAAEEPMAVLDRAISAAGGLQNLKTKLAAATWVSEGTYFGHPYKSTTYWKAPDLLVMDIDEGGMVMGYGAGGTCWSTMGEVVIDCAAAEKEYSAEMLGIVNALNLYPLKDEGVQVEAAGEADLDGRAAVGVKVSGGVLKTPLTLFFDKENGALLKSSYEGEFAMQHGTIEHRYADHRDFGGLRLPGSSVMTLNGVKVMEERILEGKLGEVDETRFQKPAQAALGVDKVRAMPEQLVAVTSVTGPYDALGPALGGLFGWVTQKGLSPMGAPTFVYLKGPGDTGSPAEFVTEVWLAVAAAGERPAAEGGFEVRTVPATEIVWRLEQGPYDQVAARYADLAKWAAENGYELAGPPAMSCLSDPQTTPPEQLLNVLYFPIKRKP